IPIPRMAARLLDRMPVRTEPRHAGVHPPRDSAFGQPASTGNRSPLEHLQVCLAAPGTQRKNVASPPSKGRRELVNLLEEASRPAMNFGPEERHDIERGRPVMAARH